MLKNIIIKRLLKTAIAIASFSVIFLTIQPFFIIQSDFAATTMIEGYSHLEKESLDVLFLGSSQMYFAVDAGKLTDEYGISSYDFGAGAQHLPTTLYYLDEALKTQTPKLVVLEVCGIFIKNSEVAESHLAWSYFPMPMSFKKFDSMYNSLNVGLIKSFEYSFVPLIRFHDKWKDTHLNDIDFVLNTYKYTDLKARGHVAEDHVTKCTIEYYNGDETTKEIPEESKKAILDIAERCREKGIKLLLLKTPVSDWTKGDSISVEQFALENNLEFIDLNENINEIGIDGDTDFYNKGHLNSSGAEKTTDYIAEILKSCME